MRGTCAGLSTLALLALGCVTLFHPAWRDASALVPIHERIESPPFGDSALRKVVENDQRFVVWSVARNGRRLLEAPHRLHDGGHCHPTRNSVTLGEPVLVQGLWGLPSRLFGDSPMLSFNFALGATLVLAGLAMFWLVWEWTRVAAAATIAALFYVFEPTRLADTVHVYIYDTTGCVLALGFAHRLFARGGYGAAAGLGLAGSLMIATSFYPLLAGVAIAVPFALWLILGGDAAQAPWRPMALAGLFVVAVAAGVFAPYLDTTVSSVASGSPVAFAPPLEMLPGGRFNPGLLLPALAVLGALWPRGRCLVLERDPRGALAVAAILVAWLAAGPLVERFGVPDLYGGVAAILPGLDQVRAPARISAGLMVIQPLLAGIGVAACLRALPERLRLPASGACVLLVYLLLLHAPSSARYLPLDLRPEEALLSLFDELADVDGAILELPILPFVPGAGGESVLRPEHLGEQARQVFASAFHQRRVSGCISSRQPPERERLYELERHLDRPEVLEELRQMGFAAIVVHQSRLAGEAVAQLQRSAGRPGARVKEGPRDAKRLVFLLGAARS